MKVNDLKTTLDERFEARLLFIKQINLLTQKKIGDKQINVTMIAKEINFHRNTIYAIYNGNRLPLLPKILPLIKKLEELNKKL